MIDTYEILKRAKRESSFPVPSLSKRNEALHRMADQLLRQADEILSANQIDLDHAKGKLSAAMMDRLMLDEKRLTAMAEAMRNLAQLEDPVNRVISDTVRPNGLNIRKIQVPFGVVAVIYESRPNVTADTAALILKSGNTAVLRSGKDAWNSAAAIVKALRAGLKEAEIHEDRIQLVEDTSRTGSSVLMTANGYVDLLIPRGGKGLINAVMENATVPVIETGTGICHIYVDDSADMNMALNIIENAKCSRPSVCNAEEVLLVHQDLAPVFLPKLKKRLTEDRIAAGKTPVEFRLEESAMNYISGTCAAKEDFDTEFLDYILAVKVVSSIEEAIAHINAHSTHHSEAILTQTRNHADLFASSIDSAALYINASTRFTDGEEFGLGCEMGISTQKLHARGPMGLNELCTWRYIITGNGQTR